MNRFTLATLMAALTISTPALSAESIVGTWDNEDCSRPMVIGPLAMQANDTICRFDSVKRKGDRVTWKGDCNGKKRTVVAELENGKLNVSIIDGDVFFGLKRCDREDQAADDGPMEEEASGDIPAFLKKGAKYNSALRQKLFDNGWDVQGAMLRSPGDCDSSFDARCKKFPEALTCSGTGVAFCNMVWMNANDSITITTKGEDPSQMRINSVQQGTP
jgi:hypothetical protein